MSVKPIPPGFGLLVIGSEILDGRTRDRHAAACRALLKAHRLELRYTLILPDDPAIIESQLAWAMQRPEPFFACGGIGGTPDDYTRQCAARAAGTAIELHPEALVILKRRFGKEATAGRLRMIEFPAGAALIPNPVNEVPGFNVRNGYFLPGFPSMAEPMMAWVLASHFGQGAETVRQSLLLRDAREGDLIELFEAFTAAHAALTFSCLPRFVANGTELRLSVHGSAAEADAGMADLKTRLDRARVSYETLPPL